MTKDFSRFRLSQTRLGPFEKEDSMKTILFLLTSFLPAFTFSQSTYYYQNKIVEDTEKRKIEIRLLIDKDLLVPTLEESLSGGGDDAVKIHSIEAQNLTKGSRYYRISGTDFTFSLNMKISLKDEDEHFSIVCSTKLQGDVDFNYLHVLNCTEEQELLTFEYQRSILSIVSVSNRKAAADYYNSSDYYRPIVRVTQITTSRRCKNNIFPTEQGCPKYRKDEISKIEVAVYKERE